MKLLSPREMAQHTGWPEGRIRRLIASRKLRHIKLDGLLLMPENAVDEFLSANMIEPERQGRGQHPDQKQGALL